MAAPHFQIVLPEDSANLILNPSFEATGSYVAYAGATIARTLASATTPTRVGWYTLRVQTAGANRGVTLTTPTLANATHYLSVWVRGTFTALRFLVGAGVYTPAVIETDGEWQRYGVQIAAAHASGQTSVTVYDTTTGADFYLDNCLLEAKSYATTYFDGDTNGGRGFRWLGVKNASVSMRYAVIPGTALPNVGHGRLYDLDNTTTRVVTSASGLGLPDVANLAQEQGLVPGKVFYSTRLQERTIAIALLLDGQGSAATFFSTRKTLLAYMQMGDPFVLRFLGADTSPGTTRTLEITCVYAGGLGLTWQGGTGGWQETPALSLSCLDPVFRQTGESALYLTSYSTTAASDALFARTDSAWARMTSGLTSVTAIVVAADGRVFACGGATVKVYDGASWTTVGTVTGGGATVSGMTVGLQGDYLYATGSFTAVGAVAANYVARYDLAALTWSAMGTGLDAAGNAIHATKDGLYVIVVGGFTTAGGSASKVVARWVIGSASWSAFAAQPASGTGYGVDSYASGDIVIAGNIPAFATMTAVSGTPTVSASNTGGGLHSVGSSNSTMTYQITAVNATGETVASTTSASASIGSTLVGKVTVGWSAVTGATGYRVYRKYTSGAGAADSNGESLVNETTWTFLVQTTTNSYVDDGGVSDGRFTAYPAATPPATATDGVRSVGIARWQSSDNTWRTVGKPGGPGFAANKVVYAVKVGADGQSLYAALASDCTTVDGLAVAGVAYSKNLGAWYALGSGLTGGNVTTIDDDPAGGVWFGGAHTAGGPTSAASLAYLARWDGFENGMWLPADVAPGAAVTALAHAGVTQYAGLSSAQTPTVAAATSVTYAGTFANWPRIEIMGPLTVTSIENATAAARLYFTPTPLSIAAGEVVTLQLDPRKFGVTSSTRGLLRSALSGASKTGDFRMRPGSNTIVLYGTGATAATVVRIIDSVAHLSVDAAAA